MSTISFWKLQAIGNDFPLFREEDVQDMDLSQLAIKAADRKFGIGGDGILVLGKRRKDVVELRMFNPDGTEDFCGNGLRVAARFAFDHEWVGPNFTIIHRDHPVPSEVDAMGLIKTTIGTASYDPAQVPVNRDSELFDREIAMINGVVIRGSALTTGSTHTIVPVDQLPEDALFLTLGPALEQLSLFPDRTSVIFTQVLNPQEIKVRIWERGVGETLGCGTGSSAAAADHFRRVGGGGEIIVHNPGGDITVSMEAWNQPITIAGTAETVFEGSFLIVSGC